MKFINRHEALTLGALTLVACGLGPWINFVGILTASPTNFNSVWPVIFGGVALIIVSVLTGRYMRPISIGVGLAVLAEVAYVWFHISEAQSNSLVGASWGLYLSVLTSLFLIASTWVAQKPSNQTV
jgi:hypothetical protein